MSPFNTIVDPCRPIIMSVTDEERRMLDVFRSLKWGKVEVMIKDGKLIRIVKSESLLPTHNNREDE